MPFWRGKDLDGIRAACRLARQVLDLGHAAAAPGVTTDEIDRVARRCWPPAAALRASRVHFGMHKPGLPGTVPCSAQPPAALLQRARQPVSGPQQGPDAAACRCMRLPWLRAPTPAP